MHTILIVDDDQDIREMLAMTLKINGYGVVTADNGLRALEYLRQHPIPCLIVTDIAMPEMSGIELRKAQLSDEKLSKIPVIFISAFDDCIEDAKQYQAITCLKKPVDQDKLTKLVNQYC